MKPKVSVVLTTYNRDSVLASTIEGILGQTYNDFELIISDDCSSDSTEVICRKYQECDRRIRYQRNERNLRMPGNLNAGIRVARGEYIANVHDGDIYHTTLLHNWVSALDACPNAGFVFNAYRVLDASGKERKIYREALPPCSPGSVVLEDIFFQRWRFDSPVWGTVMARLSAYDKVGLFDERFGFCSDVDMWMRIAECFHVAYVNEPLISIPSRETLPRKIALMDGDLQRAAERMFWEARLRRYAGRPVRKGLALATHLIYVAVNRLFCLALNVRRRLMRRG